MALYTYEQTQEIKEKIFSKTKNSKEAIEKSMRLMQLENNVIRAKMESYVKEIYGYLYEIEEVTKNKLGG